MCPSHDVFRGYHAILIQALGQSGLPSSRIGNLRVVDGMDGMEMMDGVFSVVLSHRKPVLAS